MSVFPMIFHLFNYVNIWKINGYIFTLWSRMTMTVQYDLLTSYTLKKRLFLTEKKFVQYRLLSTVIFNIFQFKITVIQTIIRNKRLFVTGKMVKKITDISRWYWTNCFSVKNKSFVFRIWRCTLWSRMTITVQ